MSDWSLPNIVKKSKSNALKKLRAITYQDFDEAAKTFVRQSALRLKAGNWLYDTMPSEDFLDGEIGDFKILEEAKAHKIFAPFVVKQIFEPGTRIAVIGDVHGDLESLVVILQDLQRQGYLDEDFHIIAEDFVIMFLGDYSNYMPHSVEVVRLLFYLNRVNFGKVFLTRGNHEYALANKNLYEQHATIGQQDLGERYSLIEEFAEKFDIYYYPDLLYWYDYLPLTYYVGCANEKTHVTNFIKFSHSGIEIGFNPQQLLVTRDVRFELIENINRHNALQKILTDKSLSHLHKKIKEVFSYLKKTPLTTLAETYTEKGLIDFNSPETLIASKLGMQWNNFLPEDQDCGFAASLKNKSFYFGKAITEYFLQDLSEGPGINIAAIIRSHQHFNDEDAEINFKSSMLDKLIENKGYVRQWQGIVHTLGDVGFTSGYNSYVVVQLEQALPEWSVTHFSKKLGDAAFKQVTQALLG
ncbi:metallophosphoesterase [Candidatus Babeliales bacterium]|nr:metallophosphoesterase [Candidatus Babeliales bacterium]